jgi:drug/metabolite transporter (DMT)-like permease
LIPAERPLLGLVMLVTVVLSWGLTWPANKLILESVPPLWMAAVRAVLAALALLVLVAVTRTLTRPARQDLPILLSITLLHMVGFVVFANVGLELVSTGRSVVLAYTTPLWVAPGASLFLGERLTRRRVTGCFVGLLGLAVLFNPLAFDWRDGRAVLGNLSVLVAAFLWAASILHVRGHRWRGTAYQLLPWEMALAAVLLVPIAWLFGERRAVVWDAKLVGLLLYSAVIGNGLAYWAAAMAGRLLPAVAMSLGLLAAPVVSITVATLWLGETPTIWLALAVVLILGGVALGLVDERV